MDELTRDTEVLSLSGSEALSWYQSVVADQVGKGQGGLADVRGVPTDFQWPSLAQGAALRARLCESNESLAWADLAINVFGQLAAELPASRFAESEMLCRVSMIEKHGQSSDGICDPKVVVDWFRESVPHDFDGTQRLIQRLAEEMSVDFESQVVSPLRDTKSCLNVIRALPDGCVIPDDVQKFLPLWVELP